MKVYELMTELASMRAGDDVVVICAATPCELISARSEELDGEVRTYDFYVTSADVDSAVISIAPVK